MLIGFRVATGLITQRFRGPSETLSHSSARPVSCLARAVQSPLPQHPEALGPDVSLPGGVPGYQVGSEDVYE
jgi:hypothetical protein